MNKQFNLEKAYKNCLFMQKIGTEKNRRALTSPFIKNCIFYFADKSKLNINKILEILLLEYVPSDEELKCLERAYKEYETKEDKEELSCDKVAQATNNKFCSECKLKECLNNFSDFYNIDKNSSSENTLIPVFDTNVIPIPFLQELVINIQTNMNTPIEYVFISLITVIGVCIGLNFSLKLNDTWEIFSSILSVLIGEPSSKKSPSMKVFTDILHQIEADINAIISISNTTVEGICKFMNDNKRAILIACDELKGWLNSLGEYKGKSSSDRQFYLSAWNCERYVSLRKTTSNIVIQNTHVSLLGSTQPQVLKDMFKYLNTGDGFIERLLWVIPPDYKEIGKYIGRGKGKIDQNKMSVFRGVLREITTTNNKKIYLFDSDDDEIFDNFERELKDMTVKNPKYSALYGKATGLVGKLALIFQVFNDIESRNYDNNIISKDILTGAIEVTKYFIKQFIAIVNIFGVNSDNSSDNIENVVYSWLLNRPEDIESGFSPSLISTYKVGKIYKAEEAKNVLESLLEKGYLAYNPIIKKYFLIYE